MDTTTLPTATPSITLENHTSPPLPDPPVATTPQKILQGILIFLVIIIYAGIFIGSYYLTKELLPETRTLFSFTKEDYVAYNKKIYTPITYLTIRKQEDTKETPITNLFFNIGPYIRTLPSSIGTFTSLTSLYIYNQPIRELPAEIGNLKRIENLYIYNTNIETLPEEIGNLTSLTSLESCGNPIKSLPNTIQFLTKLESLTLCYSQLTSLPDIFASLPDLKYVDLSNNQLSSLPPSLEARTDLVVLILSGNKLSRKYVENLREKMNKTYFITDAGLFDPK